MIEENKTDCECPLAGYCERHQCKKNENMHQLCKSHPGYFKMWEECRGPGQEFTDCDGDGYPQKPEIAPISSDDLNFPLKEENTIGAESLELPPISEQAKNYVTSTFKFMAGGMKGVSDEVYEERMKICEECPLLIQDSKRCSKCGCYVASKAKRPKDRCPIGKWPDV